MLEALRRCWGWLAPRLRRALTFWRRSITFRIVTSTVLLSALVVTAVGWYLLQQTRDGLIDNRVVVVRADAARETSEAKDRLAAVVGTDDDTSQQLEQLIGPIILRGQSRGFSVVLAGPVGDRPSDLSAGGTRSSKWVRTLCRPMPRCRSA